MPKKPAAPFPFPQDLRDAQVALHCTRVECEEYARTLPWSAEPMPGWDSDKQLHSSYVSKKLDSPGYMDAQYTEITRYRAELLRLSQEVFAHPYGATLDVGVVVSARMQLKHAHEQTEDEAA
ncbi:hypothetical protein PUR49_10915 [Streptomyces sp. BE147]|uniref:hypothetical protein n=1 Tax=Streptomyces sp. BE147 TaxID=3002524 RepID=UPI002E78824C|nr:hypothetical protein [Streptomyces sp. BE147]MEE1737009.1 hypothetical protein [Streptomyces sp. BE147]